MWKMIFSFLLFSTDGGTLLSGNRNRKKEKFAAMAEKNAKRNTILDVTWFCEQSYFLYGKSPFFPEFACFPTSTSPLNPGTNFSCQ
jgi:hypothetical protein